jgi:DNA-binding XRE family transcriptional regulator
VTIYNLAMELARTPEGLVTPLAVVRACRDLPHRTLAKRVGVTWEEIAEWERGEGCPTSAMWKRLGMALGWRWDDLCGPHLDPDDAWRTLLDVRQRIAAAQ